MPSRQLKLSMTTCRVCGGGMNRLLSRMLFQAGVAPPTSAIMPWVIGPAWKATTWMDSSRLSSRSWNLVT